MTPRDRVLASIGGQEVLPVPVDVFENGIHWGLARKLNRQFGLPADDREGLLRALGAYLRWGRPLYGGPPLEESSHQEPTTYPYKKIKRNIWGT